MYAIFSSINSYFIHSQEWVIKSFLQCHVYSTASSPFQRESQNFFLVIPFLLKGDIFIDSKVFHPLCEESVWKISYFFQFYVILMNIWRYNKILWRIIKMIKSSRKRNERNPIEFYTRRENMKLKKAFFLLLRPKKNKKFLIIR